VERETGFYAPSTKRAVQFSYRLGWQCQPVQLVPAETTSDPGGRPWQGARL